MGILTYSISDYICYKYFQNISFNANVIGKNPSKIMENILKKLKSARNEKGYSQEYVAEKLKISQKSYCKIENGCTNLSVTRLIQIAYILNLDLSGILI